MDAFVYILANKKYGALYIGVTSTLPKRIYEHKEKLLAGFTKQYGLSRLVYYARSHTISSSPEREKQLKRWHRDWKINLIESFNPDWNDLWSSLF